MHQDTPNFDYTVQVNDSGDEQFVNRILIGTATTGLVRVEWMQGRLGQIIPCNWAHMSMSQGLSGYYPLRYQVADAQNLIVKEAVEKNYRWLLLWEHDCIPQPDALQRLNEYMMAKEVPVVSGLYFTRSRPSEPLIFRGRGTGTFRDWTPGDQVWCDGVPTGFLLIHMDLIQAMWEESPEYVAGNQITRRVFRTPGNFKLYPQEHTLMMLAGTSDLDWCTRVMKGGFFKKSGWGQYEGREYPFLVDTAIRVSHINMNGEQFPG
jgi:hypothetical protein